MIAKDYKQNKELVLQLYQDYVQSCENNERKVDESIKQQAQKIEDEVFNLMVLGEAKSGKSTFINAYLGEEIVPMDIRQCTSAIIKIHNGDHVELIAKTAGGGKSQLLGTDEVRGFLKDHATLSDKYRNIPVTTIDEYLVNLRGKNVSDHELQSFLETVRDDNIYNLDLDEYNRLIKEYIDENREDYGKIVTEMEIIYPLPEDMKGITIIDSPGVGASGHVGKIAEDYISEANAIIFVKSLTGQALESVSFRNFLKTNCPKKQKELLFLVLTGKANLPASDVERLREQAIEMYKGYIDQERILLVDSKIQLFLNKCLKLGTEEKIDEFFDQLDREGNDFSAASLCWLRSKGDVKRFTTKMEEESNFVDVYTALEKFARTANYYQLIAFLKNLAKEYERYITIDSSALEIAEKNLDDPDALEKNINKKKNEINSTTSKMHKGVEQIREKYTNSITGDGVIAKEAEKKEKEYRRKLDRFLNLEDNQITDSTFEELKKETMDEIEDAKDFRKKLTKEIVQECNEKLIQYTNDPSQISPAAYTPNFTETDFEKIDKEAREQTSGYKDVESGMTFLKTSKKVPYHDLKKHVKIVIDSIQTRLHQEIIPALVGNVVDYVNACIIVYHDKLTEHKTELEEEYSKLLQEKDDNEARQRNVDTLKQRIKLLNGNLQIINTTEGDIGNYLENRR